MIHNGSYLRSLARWGNDAQEPSRGTARFQQKQQPPSRAVPKPPMRLRCRYIHLGTSLHPPLRLPSLSVALLTRQMSRPLYRVGHSLGVPCPGFRQIPFVPPVDHGFHGRVIRSVVGVVALALFVGDLLRLLGHRSSLLQRRNRFKESRGRQRSRVIRPPG